MGSIFLCQMGKGVELEWCSSHMHLADVRSMHYDACDMTIPTRILERAMSLHDSYSKAYLLPFRAEHTTPCGWALLYRTLGVLTIYVVFIFQVPCQTKLH